MERLDKRRLLSKPTNDNFLNTAKLQETPLNRTDHTGGGVHVRGVEMPRMSNIFSVHSLLTGPHSRAMTDRMSSRRLISTARRNHLVIYQIVGAIIYKAKCCMKYIHVLIRLNLVCNFIRQNSAYIFYKAKFCMFFYKG